MKKRFWPSILLVLVFILSGIQTVSAEIIPARGEGQIGLQAVVLCNTLTVRKEPSGTAKAVKTLQYGALPIVTKQEGGWAYCVLGDSENSPSGWINMDYILIDPSWYKTDDKTPVYAWYDTASPKVALLDKGTTLPILKDEGDWLIVSLRGATGWIRKTESDASTAPAQWTQPERQNGERFEAVIMIEGMEETVRYEHVANDSLGIEIDFNYDLFVRYSAADHERFVSRFDDPANPAIYLEVMHRQEGAEAAYATLSEELAKEYARGYDTRWRMARKRYLQLHPLCVECLKENRITPATVVDHIFPHRGNQSLFWDKSNWQPLCRSCHNRKTGQGM